MAWTHYRSTDAGAPVLTGTAGDLITILDAVLVNGYGTKPAAGWSKAYSGTNKAAYRNGAGAVARKYYRIQDDAPGPGGAREARVRGYDAMSGIDTGTTPFPSDLQQPSLGGGLCIRKSNTADATARAWEAFADDRTLILFIFTGSTAGQCHFSYLGEFESFRVADAHAAALWAYGAENSSEQAASHVWTSDSISGSPGAPVTRAIAGAMAGGAGSALCTYAISPFAEWWTYNNNTKLQFPNPQDNGFWLSPVTIVSYEGTAIWHARGRLRGCHFICHAPGALANGDTITGSGELAGKTFNVVRSVVARASTNATTAVMAISTTAPAGSPP